MTTQYHHKILRPDAKGRISLGKLAEGISSFRIIIKENRKLILEPYSEIPAHEKWLFENKIALAKLKEGIEQSASGEVKSKGSFAKFADDEIE